MVFALAMYAIAYSLAMSSADLSIEGTWVDRLRSLRIKNSANWQSKEISDVTVDAELK